MMGLDTSHDCWHDAYSAFTRWRNKLAEVAGYDVWEVKYPNAMTMPTAMIDWGHIRAENPNHINGEWVKPPADPLIILIAHSDVDGRISREHAVPLANRIEELLPLLPDGDAGGHIGIWREKTQAFIDGLRLAAARGEDVEFH